MTASSTPPGAATDAFTDVAIPFVMRFDGSKDDRAPTENFATSYGVTQYTWTDAVRLKVVPNKPLSEATEEDCIAVLKALFWCACGCDKMHPSAALMVFNHAMAVGPVTAARLVQHILGVRMDGEIGPTTLAAVQRMGVVPFVNAMAKADEAYYATLRNASVYLRGWDRREEECRQLALRLAA